MSTMTAPAQTLDDLKAERQRLLALIEQAEFAKTGADGNGLLVLNRELAALRATVEEVDRRILQAQEAQADHDALTVAWPAHKLEVFHGQTLIAARDQAVHTMQADVKRLASSMAKAISLSDQVRAWKRQAWPNIPLPSGITMIRPVAVFFMQHLPVLAPYFDMTILPEHPREVAAYGEMLERSIADHLDRPDSEDLEAFGIDAETAARIERLTEKGGAP